MCEQLVKNRSCNPAVPGFPLACVQAGMLSIYTCLLSQACPLLTLVNGVTGTKCSQANWVPAITAHGVAWASVGLSSNFLRLPCCCCRFIIPTVYNQLISSFLTILCRILCVSSPDSVIPRPSWLPAGCEAAESPHVCNDRSRWLFILSPAGYSVWVGWR